MYKNDNLYSQVQKTRDMTERVKHIFEEENDMKKTGKILALTLASLMALSALAGCGSKTVDDQQQGTPAVDNTIHIIGGGSSGGGYHTISTVLAQYFSDNGLGNYSAQPTTGGVQNGLLMQSGELDLGFVTLVSSQQKTSLEYIPLVSEEILAAVPARHPVITSPKGNWANAITDVHKEFPQLNLYALREEPFVLTYQESTLREITDHIFEAAGFKPHVLFETSSNATIATMVSAEMCCGLIPTFYARGYEDRIRFFSLPDNPSWNVMACHHKKRYLSKAARDFVSLAEEFWNEY